MSQRDVDAINKKAREIVGLDRPQQGREERVDLVARWLKETYADSAFGLAVGNLTMDRFRADAMDLLAALETEVILRDGKPALRGRWGSSEEGGA